MGMGNIIGMGNISVGRIKRRRQAEGALVCLSQTEWLSV